MATSDLLIFTPTVVPTITWKLLAHTWSYSFLHQAKLAGFGTFGMSTDTAEDHKVKNYPHKTMPKPLCYSKEDLLPHFCDLFFFGSRETLWSQWVLCFHIPASTSHWLKASGGKHRKYQGVSGEHQNCPHYHHLSTNIFFSTMYEVHH